MAEYCKECKSLLFKSSCTNKKCTNHVSSAEIITYSQVEYIEGLIEKLEDKPEYDFKNMTKKEADKIIKELEIQVELEG